MIDELRELIEHARELRRELNDTLPNGVGNTIDALCGALQSLSERNAELEGALQVIIDGSVFNQQRFAEDSETDYFLQYFKAVKERARSSLTKGGK